MKQLLVLSGKGGTGKTTVASALIHLFQAQVYADCDVDAPNLHLILANKLEPRRTDFYGMQKAEIQNLKCTQCGLCQRNCRYHAIDKINDHYRIESFACEGCAVCQLVCPVGAIAMNPVIAGELQLYQKVEEIFSTAQLKMGSGNSGLLVSEVKKQLREREFVTELAIIDGSPGIGCPVIASLNGVDVVLMVTEPSISGISDLKRIVKTARTFRIPIMVCINKANTSPTKAQEIIAFCKKEKLDYAGSIPYDPLAVKAINQGLSIVEIASPAGDAIREIYHHILDFMKVKGD